MHDSRKPSQQSMSPKSPELKASSPKESKSLISPERSSEALIEKAFSEFGLEEKEYSDWKKAREDFSTIKSQLDSLKEKIKSDFEQLQSLQPSTDLPKKQQTALREFAEKEIKANQDNLQKKIDAIETVYEKLFVHFPEKLLAEYKTKQAQDNFDKNFKKDAVKKIKEFTQFDTLVNSLQKKKPDEQKIMVENFNVDYASIASITLDQKTKKSILKYQLPENPSVFEITRFLSTLSHRFKKPFDKDISSFLDTYKDYISANAATSGTYTVYIPTQKDETRSSTAVRSEIHLFYFLSSAAIRDEVKSAQENLAKLEQQASTFLPQLQEKFEDITHQVAVAVVMKDMLKNVEAADAIRTSAEQAELKKQTEVKAHHDQIEAKEKQHAQEAEEKTRQEKTAAKQRKKAEHKELSKELSFESKEEKAKSPSAQVENPKEMLETILGYDEMRTSLPYLKIVEDKIARLKAKEAAVPADLEKQLKKQTEERDKLAKWDMLYNNWFDTQGKQFSLYNLELQKLRASFDTVKAADTADTRFLNNKIIELEQQLNQFYPGGLHLIEHYNSLTLPSPTHEALLVERHIEINKQMRNISTAIFSSVSNTNDAILKSIHDKLQELNKNLDRIKKTTPTQEKKKAPPQTESKATIFQPTSKALKDKAIEEKREDQLKYKLFYNFISHLFVDNEKKFTEKRGKLFSHFVGHKVYTNVLNAIGWDTKKQALVPPKDYEQVMKDVLKILQTKIRDESLNDKFYTLGSVDPKKLKELDDYYQIYGVAIHSIVTFGKDAENSSIKLTRASEASEDIMKQLGAVSWNTAPVSRLLQDKEDLEQQLTPKSKDAKR